MSARYVYEIEDNYFLYCHSVVWIAIVQGCLSSGDDNFVWGFLDAHVNRFLSALFHSRH